MKCNSPQGAPQNAVRAIWCNVRNLLTAAGLGQVIQRAMLALLVGFSIAAAPKHAVAAPPDSVIAQARAAGHGLQLSFADEFNQLNLRRGDTGVWTTSFGLGGVDNYTLTNNRELQLYVDPSFTGSGSRPLGLQPFAVRGGVLDITARRTPLRLRLRLWNYPFYSGLLTTRLSFAQQYGYFEIRVRAPSTIGAWPAFWLLPVHRGWPPELDVMEHLGRMPNIYFAGYHANPGGVREGGAEPVEIPGPINQFQRYGMLWDEERVIWYLNGTPVRQISTPDDMHVPMYLLINLAVGGPWAHNPSPFEPYPATMSVDYVRAYAFTEFASD